MSGRGGRPATRLTGGCRPMPRATVAWTPPWSHTRAACRTALAVPRGPCRSLPSPVTRGETVEPHASFVPQHSSAHSTRGGRSRPGRMRGAGLLRRRATLGAADRGQVSMPLPPLSSHSWCFAQCPQRSRQTVCANCLRSFPCAPVSARSSAYGEHIGAEERRGVPQCRAPDHPRPAPDTGPFVTISLVGATRADRGRRTSPRHAVPPR